MNPALLTRRTAQTVPKAAKPDPPNGKPDPRPRKAKHMPSQEQILADELTAGHPNSGAYPLDDQAAADVLNTANRTRLRAVSMTELREWAALNARAFKLRVGIDNTGLSDQVRNLCIILDSILGTDDGKLDPSNGLHVAMVNELVAAGVWSAADRTALVAAATDSITRGEELGLGHVQPGHVANAKAQQ